MAAENDTDPRPELLPAVLADLPDRREPADPSVAADLEIIAPLADKIGYEFRRPALLRTALTLGSWCNENASAGWPTNACLEFFGDAVLDLLVADALWRKFPTLDEGALTRLRASLVSEDSLAPIAAGIGLGDWLFLGRGDIKRGVRTQSGALADALEAVLGAVYLDARAAGGDPMRASAVVFDVLFGARVRELTPEDGLDVKSRLQHWAQSKYRLTPSYEMVGERPPPGQPHWKVRVVLRHGDGAVEELGRGEGRSRRSAERAAARAAIERNKQREREAGQKQPQGQEE